MEHNSATALFSDVRDSRRLKLSQHSGGVVEGEADTLGVLHPLLDDLLWGSIFQRLVDSKDECMHQLRRADVQQVPSLHRKVTRFALAFQDHADHALVGGWLGYDAGL
jgi:hypothetical protein